mmetsp:Transcript_60015/g.140256  ORF Transcript_60015/g.140256 Transcript_60015/m.140256 type:complete len:370 (+) Transcript_60015:61-1170(+)
MARLLLAALALQATVCLAVAEGMPMVPVTAEQDAEPPHQELGGSKDPMSELLHWAIEHSDPEVMKNLTERYKEQNLTIQDVYGQEVIDAFFKNEGDVMSEQIAVIQDFRNSSVPESHLRAAMEELEELLHQIDHAGNLRRMGGMQPLLDLALGDEREEETRTLALWALGVAVQNNAPAQKDLHELGGLQSLAAQLQLCRGAEAEGPSPPYCAKLLFALSGLLKNAPYLQLAADGLGVSDWMIQVGAEYPSAAVVKKALGYLDILLAQNPEVPFLDRAAETSQAVVATLLKLVAGSDTLDVDASEKALAVFSRLIALRPDAFGRFAQALEEAARSARRRCEQSLGQGEEVCLALEEAAAEVGTHLPKGEL